MESEVLAICSSLGCFEGEKYLKEPDCFESLKDLIRFLKYDKESCAVRRLLGETKVIAQDLIPIVIDYHDDDALFDVALRLLVNLTQPAGACFNGVVPRDSTTFTYFAQISSHLSACKKAFANVTLFEILTRVVKKFLDLDWENKDEEDGLKVERILMLARNVLQITAIESADTDISTHDEIIWAVHQSGFTDVLLRVCSSYENQRYVMYALEITCLMLREQKPEILASSGVEQSKAEKAADSRDLASLLARETALKEAMRKKVPARHSNFAGTFLVAGLKAVNDDHSITSNRIIRSVADLDFDRRKKQKRTPKNRQTPAEARIQHRSLLKIRVVLRDFCLKFVDKCYNATMRRAKDVASADDRRSENVDQYYVWSLTFFMCFCRCANVKLDRVSETLNVNTFHFVQMLIEKYVDMMTVDKLSAKSWGRKVHNGLKAYRELLNVLVFMSHHPNEVYRRNGSDLATRIFVIIEYRELLLVLLKKHNSAFLSKLYLRDLIEANHVQLRLLESLMKANNGHFLVQKPVRKAKKRRSRKQPTQPVAEQANGEQLTPEQQEEHWDSLLADLSALIQGNSETLIEDVPPCDFAEDGEAAQQLSTVRRVKKALHETKLADAVSMFRNARALLAFQCMLDKNGPQIRKEQVKLRWNTRRVIWPNMQFGPVEMLPEEELTALREIFLTVLPEVAVVVEQEQPQEEVAEGQEEGENEEEMDEEGESEYPMEHRRTIETEFNFLEFVKRFSHPDILHWYIHALGDISDLTPTLAHAIVRFLHRVSHDLEMTAVVFQASLFRIFQKILNDRVLLADKIYDELRSFAKFVLRKFIEVAQKNPVVFAELLFWKGYREAYEIQNGYGSYTSSHDSEKAVAWTEELDSELEKLYEEFMRMEEKPEGDVVDYIEEKLSVEKTRKQIILELRHINMNVEGLVAKGPKGVKAKGRWSEDEVEQLRVLFETFRDAGAQDIVGSIIHSLEKKRTRTRIVDKLLELGVIVSKAEVKKRKSHGVGVPFNSSSRQDENDEESGDEEGQSQRSKNAAASDEDDDEFENFLAENVPGMRAPNVSRERVGDESNESAGSEDGSSDNENEISVEAESAEARNDDLLFATVGSASSALQEQVEALRERVVASGLGLAFDWLKDSLMDAVVVAERFAAKGGGSRQEGMPLVPFNDVAFQAMEDGNFQQLLTLIGVVAPSNEQESFWRLRGDFSPVVLRNFAAALDDNGAQLEYDVSKITVCEPPSEAAVRTKPPALSKKQKSSRSKERKSSSKQRDSIDTNLSALERGEDDSSQDAAARKENNTVEEPTSKRKAEMLAKMVALRKQRREKKSNVASPKSSALRTKTANNESASVQREVRSRLSSGSSDDECPLSSVAANSAKAGRGLEKQNASIVAGEAEEADREAFADEEDAIVLSARKRRSAVMNVDDVFSDDGDDKSDDSSDMDDHGVAANESVVGGDMEADDFVGGPTKKKRKAAVLLNSDDESD